MVSLQRRRAGFFGRGLRNSTRCENNHSPTPATAIAITTSLTAALLSPCRIARHDDPRRAADHHRPLAGAAREDGTNRGRGAGADVVGLISEHAPERADL